MSDSTKKTTKETEATLCDKIEAMKMLDPLKQKPEPKWRKPHGKN